MLETQRKEKTVKVFFTNWTRINGNMQCQKPWSISCQQKSQVVSVLLSSAQLTDFLANLTLSYVIIQQPDMIIMNVKVPELQGKSILYF